MQAAAGGWGRQVGEDTWEPPLRLPACLSLRQPTFDVLTSCVTACANALPTTTHQGPPYRLSSASLIACVHLSMSAGWRSTAVTQMSTASCFMSTVQSDAATRGYLAILQGSGSGGGGRAGAKLWPVGLAVAVAAAPPQRRRCSPPARTLGACGTRT